MKCPPIRSSARASLLLLLSAAAISAAPLSTPRLTCEVVNTAALTTLTVGLKDGGPAATLLIDWVSDHDEPTDFKSDASADNSITSTHRLGRTTVTRTIVASEAADGILLHVRADQPGPVHFTARWETEEPVEIRDRRQLVLSGKKLHGHAWILPFESDVRDDGERVITLAGEGEALIILNLTGDPEKHPIADTLSRLGKRHDPDHTPPGPHLIWHALKP